MESDWKKYSEIIPTLRERHFGERNAQYIRMLADPKKNETERFWDTLERMQKEARTVQACLDHHSRSRMVESLMMMRKAGMLMREDMIGFSAQLRDQIWH